MGETPIEIARRARKARAVHITRLKAGTTRLADVLKSPPDALKTCDVYAVILATYNMGIAGARTVCAKANVDPTLTLGELTKIQRQNLIKNLPKRAK